jgi:hypothetical protein
VSPERAPEEEGEKNIGYQSTLPESRCRPTSLIYDIRPRRHHSLPRPIANDRDTLTARCMSLTNILYAFILRNLVVCSLN